MAKKNKNATTAYSLNFTDKVYKAMRGDKLMEGEVKGTDFGKLDFQKDLDGLNPEATSYLRSLGNDQLNGILDAKEAERFENEARTADTSKPKVTLDATLGGLSKAMRNSEADKASAADDRLTGTGPGSGNKKDIAEGNGEKVDRSLYGGDRSDIEAKPDGSSIEVNSTPKEVSSTPSKTTAATEGAKTEGAKTEGAKTDDSTDDSTDSKLPDNKLPDSKLPKDFSNNLNYFVLQAYHNGQFGDWKSIENGIKDIDEKLRNTDLTEEEKSKLLSEKDELNSQLKIVKRKAGQDASFFILDKLATGLANAGSVLNGGSASRTSAWEDQLKKTVELLGKDTVQNWWSGKSDEERKELVQSGAVDAVSAQSVAETGSNAINNAEVTNTIDTLKNIDDSIMAIRSDITEIDKAIAELRSNPGWDDYTRILTNYVGAARGLDTIGSAGSSSTHEGSGSSNKAGGSASGGGNVGVAKLNGNAYYGGEWSKDRSSDSSSSSTANKDVFAYANWAPASAAAYEAKGARKKANDELISKLEDQKASLQSLLKNYEEQRANVK